jgi:hypothetical protein
MVFGEHDLQVNDEDFTPFGGGDNLPEANGDVTMFGGDVNMLAGDVNMFDDVEMGGMDIDIPDNDMNPPYMYPSPEAQITQQPQEPQVSAPQAAAQSVSPWGRPNLTTNFLRSLDALDDQPQAEPVAGPSRSPAQLRRHPPEKIIHQEFFPLRLLLAPCYPAGIQPTPNVSRENAANQGGKTRPGNQAGTAQVPHITQGQQGNGYQPQGQLLAPFAPQPQRQQGRFKYQLYNCDYCDYGQTNARNMKYHMRTIHPHEESPEFEANPEVQCPYCYQLFMPRGLGSHIKFKHPNMERPDTQWGQQWRCVTITDWQKGKKTKRKEEKNVR